MVGGDLSKLLKEYQALDEVVAKFYLAQIVLALESIHNSNIIHRDLKPENLLVIFFIFFKQFLNYEDRKKMDYLLHFIKFQKYILE